MNPPCRIRFRVERVYDAEHAKVLRQLFKDNGMADELPGLVKEALLAETSDVLLPRSYLNIGEVCKRHLEKKGIEMPAVRTEFVELKEEELEPWMKSLHLLHDLAVLQGTRDEFERKLAEFIPSKMKQVGYDEMSVMIDEMTKAAGLRLDADRREFEFEFESQRQRQSQRSGCVLL